MGRALEWIQVVGKYVRSLSAIIIGDCYQLKDLPTPRAFFIGLAGIAEDSEVETVEPWVSLGVWVGT